MKLSATILKYKKRLPTDLGHLELECGRRLANVESRRRRDRGCGEVRIGRATETRKHEESEDGDEVLHDSRDTVLYQYYWQLTPSLSTQSSYKKKKLTRVK